MRLNLPNLGISGSFALWAFRISPCNPPPDNPSCVKLPGPVSTPGPSESLSWGGQQRGLCDSAHRLGQKDMWGLKHCMEEARTLTTPGERERPGEQEPLRESRFPAWQGACELMGKGDSVYPSNK